MPTLLGRIQLIFSLLHDGSLANSLSEPPVRLSIEETGGVHAKDHLSVEESDDEKKCKATHLPASLFSSGACADEAPRHVLSLSEASTDPQGSHFYRQDRELFESPDEVPVGEALELYPGEQMDPDRVKLEELLSGALAKNPPEKKTKRRRRKRKPLRRKDARHPLKNDLCPLAVLTTVLTWLLNYVRKAVVGMRMPPILLIFAVVFVPMTSGYQRCGQTLNISPDDPITVRNDKMKVLCSLSKLPTCPNSLACNRNLSFCSVSHSQIKSSFSQEHFGFYYLEYDGQKKVKFGIEDCLEGGFVQDDPGSSPKLVADITSTTGSPSPGNSRAISRGVLISVSVAVAVVVFAVGYYKCKPRSAQSIV